MPKFNYQQKVWGESSVALSPYHLGYLRLLYCLKDLEQVKGKVVDIGCGGGGFTKALKKYRPDLKIYGIDISEKAVAAAKKDAGGVLFQLGGIYDIPFSDNSFDAVVIADVLEHIDKPEKAIKEVNRILKPGGVFHAFIPIEGSKYALHAYLLKLGWRAKEKHAGHIQRFTFPDIKQMLTRNGFSIHKKQYSGHILGQLVDVGYFTFLDLFNKKMDTGLESYLEKKKQKNIHFSFAAAAKNSITQLVNYEGKLLHFLPGFGLHITVKKLHT